MKNSLGDYLWAAFHARPWGMFLPPNWLGLATVTVLGFWEPGIWLIGLGLEMAYLLILSHQSRFRAIVDGQRLLQEKEGELTKRLRVLSKLDKAGQRRFAELEKRCVRILESQNFAREPSLLNLQTEGLMRLQRIYLSLLQVQWDMGKMLAESGTATEELLAKREGLRSEIAAEPDAHELNESRAAQLEILEKRMATLNEGAQKLRFSESELTRIEQQVALIGDEVRLASAPAAIGSQIDQISDGLEETNRWLGEQRRLFEDSDVYVTSPSSLQN